MIRKIVIFFDRLEDHIRAFLSKRPILYAIIASIGIILIWRGVWHTADMFSFLNGPISFVIGTVILLLTGVFVSSFIGNKIILTGLTGTKKLTELTEKEVEEVIVREHKEMEGVKKTLDHIEKELSEIKRN